MLTSAASLSSYWNVNGVINGDSSVALTVTTRYFLFDPRNFGIELRAGLDGSAGKNRPAARQLMITDL